MDTFTPVFFFIASLEIEVSNDEFWFSFLWILSFTTKKNKVPYHYLLSEKYELTPDKKKNNGMFHVLLKIM